MPSTEQFEMPRADHAPFNIRSSFARERAHELARMTGMTATQVVEDALRGYVPVGVAAPSGRLVRRGPLFVISTGGKTVPADEVDAAIEESRNGERDD